MMRIMFIFLSSLQVCLADLRMAAQPRANRRRGDVTDKDMFKVLHQSRRRYQAHQATRVLYFEPSSFNYAGLENQREKAYDNFLRSNIDNEQDKRNFNTEDGKDHLPFRTYEGATSDVGQTTIKYKIPNELPGPNLIVDPGVATLVPLRWNNPHASELEVNVWIHNIANKEYVVPVRKPTCSGEGYQDNAFSFTIPKDFNKDLKAKLPGFQGCNARGKCTLQIYAHSVESRTYAIGVPLIVNGYEPGGETTGAGQIMEACTDVGTNLNTLKLLTCRPSSGSEDDDPNIPTATPYKARLVSDVYNHAYQNKDYSPYSGQQCTEISKNLQASCVLKMLPANRGELGQRALLKDNRDGFFAARALDRKAKHLYKKYESMANSIIKLLEWEDKSNDTIKAAASYYYQFTQHGEPESGVCEKGHRSSKNNIATLEACQDLCRARHDCEYVAYNTADGPRKYRCAMYNNDGCAADNLQDANCCRGCTCKYTTYKKEETRNIPVTQKTETCFRCKEVGSTVAKRQETNTYIPSFKIENTKKCNALKELLKGSRMYGNLLSADCHVNIYVATLNDLREEFNQAITKNITYLGPMIKTTMTTMADATNFKKIDADGNEDKGLYAARRAYTAHGGPPWKPATEAMLKNIDKIIDTMDGQATEDTSEEMLEALRQPCTYTDNCETADVAFDGKVAPAEDMDALMADTICDDPGQVDDEMDEKNCPAPVRLFPEDENLEALELGILSDSGTTDTSTTSKIPYNPNGTAGGSAAGGLPFGNVNMAKNAHGFAAFGVALLLIASMA